MFLHKKLASIVWLIIILVIGSYAIVGFAQQTQQNNKMSGQELFVLLSRAFPKAKVFITHGEFVALEQEELKAFLAKDDTPNLNFTCPESRKVIHFLDNSYKYFNWTPIAIGWAAFKQAPGWIAIVILQDYQIIGINVSNHDLISLKSNSDSISIIFF